MDNKIAGLVYIITGLIFFFAMPWIVNTSLYAWFLKHSVQIYTYGGRVLGAIVCLVGVIFMVKGEHNGNNQGRVKKA